MNEPTMLELIQQEIDGESSAEESARLRAGLEADPSARRLRDELASLADELDAFPSVDPPPRLSATILERIRRSGSVALHPAATAPRRPARAGRRGPVTILYAAAAGLVIGLLISPLLVGRRPDPGSFDWIAATGSMVRRNHLLDSREISTAFLEGRAELRSAGDRIALELELEAREPALLELRFDPDRLAFEAIHRASGADGPLTVRSGELRIEVRGSERSTILLRPLRPGDSSLVLAARTKGEAMETTLSTEGGGR